MKIKFKVPFPLFILVGSVVIAGCGTIPKGAYPVKDFKPEKYTGTWYEVARFDYVFEKNLSNVTATYSFNQDGSIRVDNKGYNTKTGKWKQSIGKAKFKEDKSTGKLLVSFFGPFYSGYNVISVDKDYSYALVAGRNLKYLWLLSRTPTMPESIKDKYINEAENIGYNTSELIWVDQRKNP